MPHNPLLAPVAALVAWTLVMMVWMYFTRMTAMRRAGVSLRGRVGSRGKDLDGVVEDSVQWKSHNYNHLMEQPTLFYAVALSLAIIGDRDPGTLAFAWAYVGLRIAHSLVQSTVNVVKYRFLLFALASGALLLLTLRLVALIIRG
jgi:hypothetical protein